MPVTIRQAETSEDRERVFRFRYEIYVKEMGKPMPGADHCRRLLQDESDERATHLMALDNDEVVGSLRTIWGSVEIPSHYREWYGLADFAEYPVERMSFSGRFMVAQGQRRGLTTALLLREAYGLGCERQVGLDFIHTTPPLTRLFEQVGHRCYKADFIDPHLGPRTPMVLFVEDHEHLIKCRSPFLRHASRTLSKSRAASGLPSGTRSIP